MKKFRLLLFLATAVYSLQAQSDSTANQKDVVYTFVEQMPQFPGGDEALTKFIGSNIVYPQMERDNNIQGKVIVSFVVMQDGAVDSVKIHRGVSPGIDAESLRVVSLLPNFKPGMQSGKAVRVYYYLPIVFKLTGPEPKGKKKRGKK